MDRRLHPVRTPDVHWRSLDAGGVLVRASDQRRFAVNEVGIVLWDRCDGSHSVADLVDVVDTAFQIGPEQAARDVDEFLENLAREELIRFERREPAAARPASRPIDDEIVI